MAGMKANWATNGRNNKRKRDDEGLLPCPWCGKVPIVRRYMVIKTREIRYGVWCNNGNENDCPMIAIETNPFETRQEAIDAWNKRA